MKSMKDYLEFDEAKLRIVLEIKELYNSGQMQLEEAKAILKEKVKTLKPYEIALAEQELQELRDDECRKEDIQAMLILFEDIMDTSKPDLPEDHPISCYYRENEALRKILLEIEDLLQYPMIKNQWLEIYDRLDSYKIHLSRKQNQLYSTLEKKGFDRPTTTMWTLDNFIRDEIKEARGHLEEYNEEKFTPMQQIIVDDIRDLMQKEETVLYPTSMAMISPDEFEHMKSGDREIGFAWIDVERSDTTHQASQSTTPDALAAELSHLLSKHGFNVGGSAPMDVAQGKLTLEEINLIYKHLPVDITYVDENDIVKFYSDTKHRVFPRSKNVIGRTVQNCHPRNSVHIVNEIVEKFRSGEKDEVDFWINKPGFFIYIHYAAVRDENGKFRGIIEMMQNCTRIRDLQGSQTLLNWEKGDMDKGNHATPQKQDDDKAKALDEAKKKMANLKKWK